ncbi:MAG: histidine triad nucleotide-binding protein [Acidobacteria bacterium]|nr:histidine triad nucleotide-binding protein [Acidobacteriota bacterium]
MPKVTCLFCRILSGEVASTKVHEDDLAYAFIDIDPKAPSHVLIIPKDHIDSLNDISKRDEPMLGHLLRLAPRIANQLGFAEAGFRTVINTGTDGGQSVDHLHIHLLGGRALTWPPG